MGRILVLLTLVGLVAAFFVIYNTSLGPPQVRTSSNSNAPSNGNTRSTKSSHLDKGPGSSQTGAASGKRSGRSSGSSRDASETETPDEADKREDTPAKAQAGDGSEPLPTIKTDSTPVYEVNSKRSKVLRRLNRGEKVRPDLEVLDSEGRWRIVRGKGKEKAGFVREEQIERRPSDSSTAKNKQGNTRQE
jgi:hypothetical protein